MDFVQNILCRLFGKEESSHPFLSGQLERNAAFAEAYAKWKSDECIRDLQSIAKVYEGVKFNSHYHPGLFVFDSPQANGFYFSTKLDLPSKNFDFLLDYFAEKLLANCYQEYMADRRYEERSAVWKRTDRRYLKPEYDGALDKPLNQRYGNVHIELSALSEKPQYLKVMANVYSGRNYARPLSFENLASVLFARH